MPAPPAGRLGGGESAADRWLRPSYLLPHLLPSKPGLDTHSLQRPADNTIQRVFKMSFVPVGFWQRFIARMLISLAEMDLQVPGPRSRWEAWAGRAPLGSTSTSLHGKDQPDLPASSTGSEAIVKP